MEIEKYLAGILTALMAASLLSASGLAQLVLKNYPGFFAPAIPLIVVGEAAHPADVVGAIDIAVTLAGLSVQSVPIPGIEPKVDGKEIEGAIRGTSIDSGWIDKSVYSKLVREVVKDSAEKEHYVLEQIKAVVAKFEVNVTDTFLDVDAEAVKYKISFTPSMPTKEKVTILGKEYEIIEITNTVLKLGETKETAKLAVGEGDSIGPYKVSVYGVTLDGKLKLTVLKDTTSIAGPTFSAVGDFVWLDENKLKLEVKDIFVGYEAKEAWIILKLTHVNTIVGEGKDSPFDANYLVPSDGIVNDTNGLISLELRSKLDTVAIITAEGQIPLVKPGEVFEGPAGYFKLLYRGLTTEDTEKIVYDKEGFVTFNDKNRLEAKVNASKIRARTGVTESVLAKGDIVGVSGFAVEVVDVDAGWIKLKHRVWEENISTSPFDVSTGYGFSVAGSIYAEAGNVTITGSEAKLISSLGANISTDVVEESPGVTIDLTYADKKYNVTVSGQFDLTTENTKGLTSYGSVVTLGGAKETVEIIYPDKQIKARALLGELAPAPEQVVEKYVPIVTPVGKLDEEVDKTAYHLILVGGPAINKLTAEFYGVAFPTYGAMIEEQDLTAKIFGRNEATIEVKKDVFAADKIVMVVAGWEKENTRVAALALQRYAEKLVGIDAAKVKISGTAIEVATITPV